MSRTILAKLLLVPFLCGFLFASEDMTVFFDAGKIGTVVGQSAATELKGSELFVMSGLEGASPGIVLRGNWNIPADSEMVIVMTNHDHRMLYLRCRLDSAGFSGSGRNSSVTSGVVLHHGETREWRFRLPMKIPQSLNEKFIGMRGNPFGPQGGGNSAFDSQNITQVTISAEQRGVPLHWSIKSIVAKPVPPSDLLSIPEEKFFPMIDKYGQFIHRDWAGKIKDDSDLKKAYEAELIDLEAHPSPADRNKYGGWTAGPKMDATGHFRVEKVNGKWWLVDPEGYLFWSNGLVRVDIDIATTPITHREFYFADLPPREGLFSSCYRTGNSSRMNYQVTGPLLTFDFSRANFIRKYGEDWSAVYNDLVHKRLRSWGINTLANYSSAQFYGMNRTPYTLNLGVSARAIAGSAGYWGQFGDPFDPRFRQSIRTSAQQAARAHGQNPWCLGFFVQNEISWGTETSLSLASLTSPADQPAKIAIVEHLKKKYEDIAKLNAVWQNQYESWDALLHSTTKPNERLAYEDLLECYRLITECYFRTINEELKAAMPHKLYMGCRFSARNQIASTVAAEYCDIVSFNEYRYDLDGFSMPEGIDKPCIVGEFHFGALDRGMFHTGLCPVESQAIRAETYERYVKSGLANPLIVGTHWHLYMDQATTGRPLDNENYQVGFLSSCDSPYPEIIGAARRVGEQMYEFRYGGRDQFETK